jgi:AraC-like DNA-binding protein
MGVFGEEANVMVEGREEERTHVRCPLLRGVELVAASFEAAQPPPVLQSQLTLMLCDEGGGEVGWGRDIQSLPAGAVFVRAPQQVSVVMHRPQPGTRCRIVLVEPELLPPAAQETRRLMRSGSFVTRATPLVEGVRTLWDAVTTRAPGLEQQSRLASLLAAVIEVASQQPPRPPLLTPAVARTREALHERFAEEVPLEQLAAIAGMSKCHLVHLFHKEVGLPPHAYQIQLRVARARVLVAAGVPLAEVATMTGFADQSHLTRLFKRVVGMPPGQYAALLAAQSAPLPQPSLAMSSTH